MTRSTVVRFRPVTWDDYTAIRRSVEQATLRLDPANKPAQQLADYPLARAFKWT